MESGGAEQGTYSMAYRVKAVWKNNVRHGIWCRIGMYSIVYGMELWEIGMHSMEYLMRHCEIGNVWNGIRDVLAEIFPYLNRMISAHSDLQ